jgi:hypothetical protein
MFVSQGVNPVRAVYRPGSASGIVLVWVNGTSGAHKKRSGDANPFTCRVILPCAIMSKRALKSSVLRVLMGMLRSFFPDLMTTSLCLPDDRYI